MPKITEVADRDEVLRRTLHLTSPRGIKFPLEMGFYVNRVTQAPIEIDLDAGDDGAEDVSESGATGLRNAAQTCEWVADWDLEGPLEKPGGVQVAGDGPIPLDPYVVRYVPSWITDAINSKLLDIVFPNRTASPKSQRR